MAVAVVTDSTSDISQTEATRLGLTVVPLNIHFGTESLRDGVDIMPAEFFERLRSTKELPKTSQPSAGVFLEVFQRLAQETDEIVSIHLSSKLSGTCNSARAAREALGGRARVEIVDSETVSWPLGFAARMALEAATAGADLAACAESARGSVARTRLYFVLDTLEYLQRGGRIGRARAFLGQVFNIKPILTLRGGEVAPLERVRSRMKAEERLFELATAEPNPRRLAVAHSSSDDEARRWVERLESERPGVPVEMAWLGPVVGVYAGPNTLGMAGVSNTHDSGTDGEHGVA
jgi:fatty acid kinase fatty acid binding subunit